MEEKSYSPTSFHLKLCIFHKLDIIFKEQIKLQTGSFMYCRVKLSESKNKLEKEFFKINIE